MTILNSKPFSTISSTPNIDLDRANWDAYLRAQEFNGVPLEVGTAYLNTLLEHIKNVQAAGAYLGVDSQQLKQHDLSKFSNLEFFGYAMGREQKSIEFKYAWLNHLHCNPHHWQHWIFPSAGASDEPHPEAEGVMYMPLEYSLEMVADWMGASKTYLKTWDMGDWLLKNVPKITLHPQTAKDVSLVLRELGYATALQFVSFRVLEG